MKKWLFRIAFALLSLIVGISTWGFYNLRDRHSGYSLELSIPSQADSVNLQIGFGKQIITPKITDTWNDANGDARYNTKDGDTFNDTNGNGKFDAVWIAGFSNGKPAQGVHDDVWARTMVLDDGQTRIALVVLDAVGFMHDDIVDIRKGLPAEWKVDYTLIASTHTHESNDLIGIWGPDAFHSGVDDAHMEYLKAQVTQSIGDAVQGIRPAHLIFAEDLSGQDSLLIKDTRKPIVKATGIHVMQAVDAENGQTLGTLVNWANHPETLWDKNLLISSDFPHYLRESLESGIVANEDSIHPGYGGIAIFFNGAVGGLMTPHPSLPFNDPVRDTLLKDPSFEKTRTLGEQIALLSINALQEGDTVKVFPPLALEAQTLILPLANPIYRLASGLGLIKRGSPGFFKTRTEVAAIQVGPASILSIPGEIYPEILYGGIESPPGQDFDIPPLEVPPLEEKMTGPYKFYFGLSNDEIGYIIPKSEWDAEEPWLYLDENDTYGEENSLGPETSPILYEALSKLLEKL